MVDDGTVLKLAKNRLQTLRAKSYSLEKLAVRSIVKNIGFYLNSDDQLGQLKTLPANLKETLLQMLLMRRRIDYNGKTEEFEVLMRIFPHLLNSRTRCIDLNGIISFDCPDDSFQPKRYMGQNYAEYATLEKATEWCEQLILWIETLSPKVETLIIRQNDPFNKIICPFDRKPQVNPNMLQSLMKMQNLKILDVNLHRFKVTDVYEMFKNLPNLQYLNVQTLKKEYLIFPNDFDSFSFDGVAEVMKKIYRELLWLNYKISIDFPDLEIVPYNESRIIWDDFNENKGRVRYDGPIFKGRKIPGKSYERHILVNLAEHEVEYPGINIRSLFETPSPEASLDERYPDPKAASTPQVDKITQLNFEFRDRYSDVISLQNDLSTAGQHLKTLNFSNTSSSYYSDFSIDVATISKYCPTLEKLSLSNVCLKSSTLSIKVFPELKELEWKLPYIRERYSVNKNDAMILSSILSAPKLEKVVLESASFNEADLMILNSLIEEKKILSQLHTFHFYLNTNANDRFEYLTNIFKSACAFLPKLTELRVSRMLSRLDPLHKYAIRKDDRIFDQCTRSLLSLFEIEK